MTKKAYMFVLGAILIAAVMMVCCSARQDSELPKLNVLMITLDTTRADRLGCYGYAKPTSPNLDALARESVVFDSAIAQAAVTPTSHASILTGREPYHHGLRVFHGLIDNRLGDSQVTLAEVWQSLGGQTAAFVSAFPVTAAFGLDQGFKRFDADFPQSDGKGLVTRNGVVNTGMSQRRADETTQKAVTWLRSEADLDKPLFMWVHYFDPHDAYVIPPLEVRKRISQKFKPASKERADFLRAIYDCEIHFMDAQIGRLLNEFEALGLWDNTMVVVVADHGEGLGDHDWWTHGILYQEQIRVPLLIRVPGIHGGSRIRWLVRTIDIMPTILEAAEIGRDTWPDMDGVSLFNEMQTGRNQALRYAYSESLNMLRYSRHDMAGKWDNKNDKQYCLIQGDHKFIYHQLHPKNTEFYNLVDDPKELKNLAGRRPHETNNFLKRLKQLNAFSGFMPGMTPTDRDRLRQLESLGYTQ